MRDIISYEGLSVHLHRLRTTTVTLGGHGHAKLTGEMIKALTVYHDRTIKFHREYLDGMENAVLASFYYVSSTDARPQYDRCI